MPRELTAVLLLGLVCAPPLLAQEGEAHRLTADTTLRGQVLDLDFPALHIGIAEYAEGPTGTTVFYFPNKAKIAVDVRGGAPGTMNTDYLRLGYDRPVMDAVVFAGGSWYGLSAGTGVAEGIKEMRGNSGATRGMCIGYASPEAAEGGAIALIESGDVIRIDAEAGKIEVMLSAAELDARRAAWRPPDPARHAGTLYKYAATVGPANLGAVTHPGAVNWPVEG